MRNRLPRLALAAFLLTVAAARPALADVTITGTVGELGVVDIGAGPVVRFKLTDANQTATCNPNAGAKYAWFGQFSWYREWYAMLLVSKKGAQISCILSDNVLCQVKGCTLP